MYNLWFAIAFRQVIVALRSSNFVPAAGTEPTTLISSTLLHHVTAKMARKILNSMKQDKDADAKM